METNANILTGREAIAYATAHNLPMVHKYADPTEGARDVTLDEAEEIVREDPGLIWIERSDA